MKRYIWFASWLILAIIAVSGWGISDRIFNNPAQAQQPEAILSILPENTLTTGFTVRYAGNDVYETAATLAQVTFPATSEISRPNAVILADPSLEAGLMTVEQLIHMPIDAPILYTDAERLPPVTKAMMEVLKPVGISYDSNVQVLVVGLISDEVVAEVEAMGLKTRRISGNSNDPVDLAFDIDAYRASMMGNHPDVVFIASLDEPVLALPATAFLAHAMSNIAFVGRDSIPEKTGEMLENRYGPAYMYIMGSESAVSEEVAKDLSNYGHVQRLSAEDPYQMSSYFAGYADLGNNFGYWIWRIPRMVGWGVAEPGHNFTIANPDNWAETIAGSILSHRGKHGPMLLVQQDSIPDSVRGYLDYTVRPRPTAPRDQLFNHGSIVGNSGAISTRLQAEIDNLLQPKSLEAAGE